MWTVANFFFFFSEHLALLRRWRGRDARYCGFKKVDRRSSLRHRCFGCQLYCTTKVHLATPIVHSAHDSSCQVDHLSPRSRPVGFPRTKAYTHPSWGKRSGLKRRALCSRLLALSIRKREAMYRGYHMGILHIQNNHVVPSSFL